MDGEHRWWHVGLLPSTPAPQLSVSAVSENQSVTADGTTTASTKRLLTVQITQSERRTLQRRSSR